MNHKILVAIIVISCMLLSEVASYFILKKVSSKKIIIGDVVSFIAISIVVLFVVKISYLTFLSYFLLAALYLLAIIYRLLWVLVYNTGERIKAKIRHEKFQRKSFKEIREDPDDILTNDNLYFVSLNYMSLKLSLNLAIILSFFGVI